MSRSHSVHGRAIVILLTPLDVGRILGRCVLFDQTAHDFFGVVELLQTILEEGRLFKVLHVGLPTLELVELHAQCVEYLSHARVIRQHHSAHLVLGRHVWALLGQRNLDGSGSPRNEVCQFALSDSLQRLVHLCRVYLALDDVQDRNVGAFFDAGVRQNVFGLQKTTHHVEHCCFANRLDAAVD